MGVKRQKAAASKRRLKSEDGSTLDASASARFVLTCPFLSEERRGRKNDGKNEKLALDRSTDSGQAGAMSNGLLVNESGILVNENKEVDLLHEIGSRFAAADSLHEVLGRVVEFLSAVARFDSCFVYVLEENELVLRASKNSHAEIVDRLKLQVGRGITGWVAEHKQPVAVARNAFKDPRFQAFNELPEDRFEAFLSVPVLSRGKIVGVINLQHREPHVYRPREIRLITTIGFLVGAEIEMARLEGANSELSEQLGTRKVVERAKGILQRDFQLTEEDAYLALQRQSRERKKPMREIAEAIVLGDEIKKAQRKVTES
jgi:GAF domain-containing protein